MNNIVQKITELKNIIHYIRRDWMGLVNETISHNI